MIPVRIRRQPRLQMCTLAAAGILALILAACQGASVTRRGRTGIEGERIQLTDPISLNPSPQTPQEGPPEPGKEWPPAPFEAQGNSPRAETFWDHIDFGGSVEVEGIWGRNLPYRRDRYGRTTLELDASYPKDSPRMGVVIQSRRYWDP